MSSRRNAAVDALLRVPEPEPEIQAAPVEQPMREVARPTRIPVTPRVRPKSVVRDSRRVMLFIPPKAKQIIKEMAFHSDRKEHDIYIEALKAHLKKFGYGEEAWVL